MNPLIVSIAVKHLMARKRQSVVSLLGVVLGVAFFLAISTMMLALGEIELAEELRARGHIEVTCEFCGRRYDFPELAVRELFQAARVSDDHGARH